MQSVLSCIAEYSEWYDIGCNLGISSVELDKIKQRYHSSDPTPHLVELWNKWDELSWEKLYQAVKKTVEGRRGSRTLAGFAEQQSQMDQEYADLMVQPSKVMATSTLAYDQETLKGVIGELQRIFEDIQLKLLDTLEEKGFTFKTFKRTLSTYPPQVQLRGFRTLKKISGPVDLDDVFHVWNTDFVWNFLDTTLLEHIISRLGSPGLQDVMSRYSDKLREFRERTTVAMLVDCWPNDGIELPEELEEACKTAVLTLSENAHECRLEKLEVLRKSTCKKLKQSFNLSEAALVMCKVKSCCILLTWIVHKNTVQYFKAAFKQSITDRVYFKENNITRLQLDGDVFMPMEEVRSVFCVLKLHGVCI